MDIHDIPERLTFDDVLLLPAESNVLPSNVDVKTRLTRTIEMKIPLLSAAMDTVTEHATAITMAREGGIGIIHKNLSVEAQAFEVDRVKRSESYGMIRNPVCLHPDQKINDALETMRNYSISGLPITKEGRLVGILTNRDLRFAKNLDRPIGELMTKEGLVTAPVEISLEEAKEILHEHRIEKLPLVDDRGALKGLITFKDLEKTERYPNANTDGLGRLRVGAAVGVGPDRRARVSALLEAEVDVVVIDTAHGHSRMVIETVSEVKAAFPTLPLIAGNVATAEATRALCRAGADAVKVGIGPGSICTTRAVAGVGVPQLSAVMECRKAANDFGVPVIADGGVRLSGDIVKALAAGADSVMIGNLFAGTDESPGQMILFQGRSYKLYRGMGSLGAMQEGSAERYFQFEEKASKLVPEGIEGRVPYKGPLTTSLFQLIGGLRSGMGYVGCRDLRELREKSRFVRVTPAGLREGHVHGVTVTQEAPNYRLD